MFTCEYDINLVSSVAYSRSSR